MPSGIEHQFPTCAVTVQRIAPGRRRVSSVPFRLASPRVGPKQSEAGAQGLL